MSSKEIKHIERDNKEYILPNHYYSKNNVSVLEVLQDQMPSIGVRASMKFLVLKYLFGVKSIDKALRRCTKAKYYLDELVLYLEGILGEEEKRSDPLKPTYYCESKFEPVEIIEEFWSEEEVMFTYIFMIQKYIMREKDKCGTNDLKKAQFYMDRLVKNLEEREKRLKNSGN